MTYVALLRGVNVGGNKMVSMAELRAMLTKIGLTGVSTLLQSGNVVFQATGTTPVKLEARLERELGTRLGLKADIHVRTAAEWKAIVAANPFPSEAKQDPGHLLVYVYRTPLEIPRVSALQAAIAGRELLRADGRHLYMTFPDGIGNSKAAPLVDRLLGVRGTARNWNTVLKLAAAAAYD